MDIKLYHGDCLDVLKTIPDCSIDMILCDLPYGTSACKWDSVIPFDKMWEFCERVIKPLRVICFTGCEPFSSKLRCSNLGLYKYDWIWEKPSGANFLNFKYQPAKVHENIMIFGKGPSSFSKKETLIYKPIMEGGKPYKQWSGAQRMSYGNSTVRSPIKSCLTENTGERYPRSIQKFSLDSQKFHPTQKPVALMKYLIKTYTNEGDVVLDFCMGSGTTGVACVETNRSFIGCEIDANYFEIAQKRISGVQKGGLF